MPSALLWAYSAEKLFLIRTSPESLRTFRACIFTGGVVKENGLPGWQGLVWAGGCAALALAANTDYSASGVLIICALYLTRADRKRQCLVGALLFLFELTAPLAFVLVWFYNGQRGACSPLQKKAFYWFYPVHLLVLAGITNLLL